MSSFNYEKALSLDWNGQVFVLTVRGETPLTYNYLYSYDGTNWTTSKDLSNSAVLVNKNPYNVKWTGSNYTMIGNLSTSSGSTLLRSKDGIKFSALTTTNLSAPIYDLETNLEFPHTITFPRNMTLALGGAPADTTKIAYSLDEGITWTPSSNSSAVFTSTANNAVWNGKTWVAVGSGGNTIATSSDANYWVGRGSYIFTTAGYGVAWSKEQTQWVACGTGSNSLAYSPDGVYWTAVNNSSTQILSTAFDVQWNGTIWLATGVPITGNKSIAYSYDGRSWSLPSQTNLFDVSGIKLSWNGSFWTAIGSSTAADASSNIATSIDGINWRVFYNSNLSTTALKNIYSDPITKKTLIIQNGSAPVVPTGLTASSSTATSITFTFTASTGATSYTATAVPTSGNTVVQAGITTSPATITGLQNGMQYTITMVAINIIGSSGVSSSLVYSTKVLSNSLYVNAGGGFYTNSMNHQITNNVITFEFWYKHPNTFTGQGGVETIMGSVVNANYRLELGSDFRLQYQPTYNIKNNSSMPGSSIWYHIAFVLNGTSLIFYINGVNDGSKTIDPFAVNNPDTLKFVNRETTNTFQSLDGYISEIRIWNVARTQTEIQNNMNKFIQTPYPSSLVHYIQLNQSNGSNIIDNIGNVVLNNTPGFNVNWSTDVPF